MSIFALEQLEEAAVWGNTAKLCKDYLEGCTLDLDPPSHMDTSLSTYAFYPGLSGRTTSFKKANSAREARTAADHLLCHHVSLYNLFPACAQQSNPWAFVQEGTEAHDYHCSKAEYNESNGLYLYLVLYFFGEIEAR